MINPNKIIEKNNDPFPYLIIKNFFTDKFYKKLENDFPTKNESVDGFEMIAAVKSYPPNSIGIYDMLGNVWEITSDLFNVNYYNELNISKEIINPTGAKISYSPSNPFQEERVMKGGSFLCHDSYCASYRISSKMGVSIDSGSDHVGFRTVASPKMILNK